MGGGLNLAQGACGLARCNLFQLIGFDFIKNSFSHLSVQLLCGAGECSEGGDFALGRSAVDRSRRLFDPFTQ